MGHVIRVAAAAHERGVGYFEYLALLRAARDKFGVMAADFELALSQAFAHERLALKRKQDSKPGRRGPRV